MLFKSKPKFFLDLGSEGEQQTPATIAPPVAAPRAEAQPANASQPAAAPTAATPGPAEAPAKPVTGQTTAEAIAAELAAAQASRPAPTLATFAPECVTPGGAQRRGRRRGGADLGSFREMARSMVSS